VTALSKQRCYVSEDEWSGRPNDKGQRSGGYRDRFLANTHPSLKQVTAARLDKANQLYTDLTNQLNRTIVEINQHKSVGQVRNAAGAPEVDATRIVAANPDAKLEASNRLNEAYLLKAQDVREALETALSRRSQLADDSVPTDLTQEIDRLTLQLNDLQSKALFYANEAYHTGPAAEDVVLNTQLRMGLPLNYVKYLISINENLGFAMEQAATNKSVGAALWKSAKYLKRINDAITNIKTTEPHLFHGSVVNRIQQMKDFYNKLEAVKRGKQDFYGMSDTEKTAAALEIMQQQGLNFPTVEALRQDLLQFNIEINTQLRNGRPRQYDAAPSDLNNSATHDPTQQSQAPLPTSAAVAQTPRINLPEFG
jgi:hypothetical protein